MASESIIGIDLGTTNSEVAIVIGGKPQIVREHGDPILPSCVGLDEAGKVIVGREARNQAAAAPERTAMSVKRLMGTDKKLHLGDQEYSPQEISAFILTSLRERSVRALGHETRKAVITVPAYFTDAQRQATREAGEIAGLDVVRIINEPTAAALTYESGGQGQRKILVYDLGGGTFDVSIVAVESGVVEVLSSTGDSHLGGDDFDNTLVEHFNSRIETELGLPAIREDISLQARLRRAAEQGKIDLSDQPRVQVEEDHIASVDGEAAHFTCELRREKFEAGIAEMLDRTMRAVTNALDYASLAPVDIDRVLLVGGSTRIPLIAKLLAERLGKEPHAEIDPDLCVALGAGVQAGVEMGLDMEAMLVDITPYTFGTSVVGELYGYPYDHQFVPLIRRNSKLPTTRTDLFYTLFEDQECVEFDVYQGEDPDAQKNVKIGMFKFDGLNELEGRSDDGILVTYSLDLNGILNVHAMERATGKEISGTVEDAIGHASDESLASSRERVQKQWETVQDVPDDSGEASAALVESLDSEPSRQMRDTLARARKLVDTAPEQDRGELLRLIEDLKSALSDARFTDAEAAEKCLEELLFYLE